MKQEMEASLQFRVVESRREFDALRTSWRTLEACSPEAGVFASHEWLDAALAWGESDTDMCFLLGYAGGRLVGAFPLQRERRSWKGLSFRVLAQLTVPDTQRNPLIVLPQYREIFIDTALRKLLRLSGWDAIELPLLDAEDADDVARLAQRAGLDFIMRSPQAIDHILRCEGSWEAFYGAKSRRFKKGVNNIANRVRRQFREARIEHLQEVSGEELDALVETLVRISSRSWKRATGLTLDHDAPRRFIERLTQSAARRNWLSVWLFMGDGEPVAMEYQLRFGNQIYALRSDYDEAFADVSPGAHLNLELLKHLFSEAERGQALVYHMGPGDNAYKKKWENAREELCRLRLFHPGLKGRLLYGLMARVAPAGRAVYGWMRDRREKANEK